MAWTGPSEEIVVLERIIIQNSECIFHNAETAIGSSCMTSLRSVVVIMINSAGYLVMSLLSQYYVRMEGEKLAVMDLKLVVNGRKSA